LKNSEDTTVAGWMSLG